MVFFLFILKDIRTKRCNRTGRICTGSCHNESSLLTLKDVQWYKPTTVDDLIKMVKDNKGKNYKLVFGNTGYGTYGTNGTDRTQLQERTIHANLSDDTYVESIFFNDD